MGVFYGGARNSVMPKIHKKNKEEKNEKEIHFVDKTCTNMVLFEFKNHHEKSKKKLYN